jgi:SAM-dependent methyltransferase
MLSSKAIQRDELKFYENAFGSFASQAVAEVRRETYGEDVGQSNWSTAAELRRFSSWMELRPSSHVLDVCSGSGGPALLLARENGCHVTGVDINPHGIDNAKRLAEELGLQSQFLACDIRQALPLPSASVDALWCIDSVVHFLDRLALLREWHRLLKPGGTFLYTDPTLVTGIISKEEVQHRGAPGYFVFTPPGVNERLIEQAGLRLVSASDSSHSVVELSQRWHMARAKRREPLTRLEGPEEFERLQRFLETTHAITRERRLSRVVFVGKKPADAAGS